MRVLIIVLAALLPLASFGFPTRIKDLAEFDGVRGNDLVGYGLVVGLDGTGDSLRNAPFTEEVLAGTLERLGVNVTDAALRTKNVAAVIVTAELPAFARTGGRIDVNVATIGDAKSLLGGTLVMTPLKAADGNIYAVAQGSIISGGVAVGGDAARLSEGVPTAGSIPVGARVEREVEFDFSSLSQLRIALRNADFTTAARIEDAVDKEFGRGVATTLDSGTVLVAFDRMGNISPARAMARLENVIVNPESKARVIIDHKSGTIVMGEHVRISRVAVSQGGLTLKVEESPMTSQPNPFSSGETIVLPRSAVAISQDPGIGFAELSGDSSLSDVVSGLNALGLRPRDMIAILEAIHRAGALHAELIVK